MVLDSGGKFTGRLIGSGPLRNSALTAYHVDSGTGTIIFQRVVSTDQTGRYELAGLMPNLRYALRGQADLHSMTLYPNVPCDPNQGCNLLLAGLVFPGAYNISIIPIPQLKINISPSMQVSGTVVIYDKSGAVQYQYLNGSGPFRVSLGQGNNYVSLHIEGYQALLYGASACVPSSDGQSCANFLDGMPILGSSDQEIDVSLEALPKISGRIVGGKGEMYVRACRGNFSCFDGTVNYDGTYIFNRVHPGAYYIEARGNEIVDTLFPNVPCQLSQNTRCNPELTNAQVVTVGLNDVPDINISVARTGSISGLLNPSNVGIELFKEGDISGIYGTYYIGTNNYLINDLLPGTYRARIAPGSYNFGQVFPGVNCAASCAFSQGQAILVTGNLISSNVNFMPASKNVISGVVRNAENMPIAFMPVDIFRINTTTNLLTRDGAVLTDSQGRYQYFSSSFQNGYAYILATDSENYQNMVYQSVLCARGTSMYLGTCLASGATRLTLPATAPGQFENINFQLGVVDELFSGGFEDLTR